VQEQSRQRILEAIDRLGYVPNQAASTLASARSQVIAVLVPSLTNAVFIETLSGIRDYLAGAGYQFLIGETGYVRAKEEQLIATYLAHAPAGFLLSSSEQHDILQARPGSRDIPAVRMFDLGAASMISRWGSRRRAPGTRWRGTWWSVATGARLSWRPSSTRA
jgi:LacI family gluconate utilization system Gnt-I transcriptional repressor